MATRIAGERLTQYVLTHPAKSIILSALRGPDEGGQALKISVTGRIRFIVYGTSYTRGVCPGSPLTAEELKNIKARTRDCNSHFRRHLYEAVTITQAHEIWGGLGPKLADILEEGG